MSKPIAGSSKCKELLDKFEALFPSYKGKIVYYQPYDRVSLRLTINHLTYIFTYVNEKVWGFQTEKHFIDSSRSIRR